VTEINNWRTQCFDTAYLVTANASHKLTVKGIETKLIKSKKINTGTDTRFTHH